MKTITFIIAVVLCSCSTTELAQTQTFLDAANAALKTYKVTPTK
jgi:hypothetical protein